VDDQDHDAGCRAKDRKNDAASVEVHIEQGHEAARDQPGPEEDAA